MPVHLLQFWITEIYIGNLHICLTILTTTSQIYKSWSLHDSNSTRTRTGACITQNRKGWKSRKLNHKHSHSLQAQVSLEQHLSFHIWAYYVLKTITNVAAVVYRILDQQRLL